MAQYITGIFKSKQTQQPLTALRITTSLYGVPLPWLLGGQQRAPGNVIWYGGFGSTPVSSGGKGGLFGGGAGASTTYYASFILVACEGPDISAVPFFWVNGNTYDIAQYGGTIFLGTYAQNEWPYLAANFPAQVFYYRGLCYVGFQSYNLGTSPALPQLNLEILSTNTGLIAGIPDGDPSVCWTKFFTDPFRGIGFPSFRMGALTSWQQYCIATGMLVSPLLASGVAASSFAKDLIDATNSNARWSAGFLSVIPYGDTQITAGTITTISETHLVSSGAFSTAISNAVVFVQFADQWVSDGGVIYSGTGVPLTRIANNTYPPAVGEYTIAVTGSAVYYGFNVNDAGASVTVTYDYAETASYTPNVTPVYSLTLDNFMLNQGTIGSGVSINNSPLIVVRKPRDQMNNVVHLTYLDRGNSYNPVTIELKDEASLTAFQRWRPADTKLYDFFCLGAAAQQSAALMLQRQQIARTFQWTSGKEMILLDVMDLVEVTDPGQGIFNQAVRITEIQENEDFSLTFTAEEFLGTATAPLYGIQASGGFVPNYNQAPGSANPPIIFEPTDELGGGNYIWMAVSGQAPSTWGGCFVWVSYDEGGTYQQMPGQINGSARMGVTTADLPPVTISATGQTIDQTNTLSVNLTESAGALNSGSALDATSLATACYVGPINGPGEVIAYQNATLTSTYNYGLTYLVRGAYGTESDVVDHPTGSSFARLDNEIYKIAFNQNQIGSTLFIKLQGFNQYGGGLQELSECVAYQYTILGTALASPLPAVEGLYTNFASGFQQIFWTEVDDFRNGIVYEIRQGASWATAQFLKTQAHPPFISQGNGTFWVSARCQPVAGLIVYSETPSSITISGNQLTLNLLAGYDEKATNWTGTFQNGIGVDTSSKDLRLGGSGNILTDNPLLESVTTNAATTSGNVLHFSSVPAGITAGMAVNDMSTSGVIQALSVVQSTTSTTVTLSLPVAGGGVKNGDTIVFSTADVLDYGGIIIDTPVYYTIPADHIVTSACITNASVNASTQIVGVPVGANILGISNILTVPDVLGSASTQYVDGWVEINVSQNGGSTWGGWQLFVPGIFPGNAWNFRLALESSDPNTIAYATGFSFSVQLPARIDHYQNQSVPSGGLTITFTPDGSSTAQPFNGGPGSNDVPYWNVSWQSQVGDTYTITGLSLSALTVQFFNGGNPVARSGVNIDVEGF